jgi:hypothetical protein
VLVVSISTCLFSPTFQEILKQPNIFWGACLLFVIAGLVRHDISKVAEPAENRGDIKSRSSGLGNQGNGHAFDSSEASASTASLSFDSPALLAPTGIRPAEPAVSANRTASVTGPSGSMRAAPQSRDRDLRKLSSRDRSPAAEPPLEDSGTSGHPSNPHQSGTEDPATSENQLHPEVRQPAALPVAMIDIGDPQISDAPAIARIDAIARDFADSLNTSGLDPSDPAYRKLWDDQLIKAETRFRSMYGGHAWLRHHVQLHRIMASATSRGDANQ